MIISCNNRIYNRKYTEVPSNDGFNYFIIDITRSELEVLKGVVLELKKDKKNETLLDNFKIKFGFDYPNLHSFGNAIEATPPYIDSIIKHIKVSRESNADQLVKSYYSAFRKKLIEDEYNAIHNEARSAWNGVLYTLYGESYFTNDSTKHNTYYINNPKYLTVVKNVISNPIQ